MNWTWNKLDEGFVVLVNTPNEKSVIVPHVALITPDEAIAIGAAAILKGRGEDVVIKPYKDAWVPTWAAPGKPGPRDRPGKPPV